VTAANGRLPPMPETPAAPPVEVPADAPVAAPAEFRTVTLSPIEIDALARMEASWRSACASIIVSRGGGESARWAPVRDDRNQIVAFEKAGGPETAEG